MSKFNHDHLLSFLSTAIISGRDQNLISAIAQEFKVSRQTASRWINKLIEEKYLAVTGSARNRQYSLGPNRYFIKFYEIGLIDENIAWTQDFLPYLNNLKPNVLNIVHHGFTEILNNANDHSDGVTAWVSVEISGKILSLKVSDNGIGIFRKIAVKCKLPDERLSLLELSKGKITTDSERHSGEGIFFTSRMFDNFMIYANHLVYIHNFTEDEEVLDRVLSPRGTYVFMSINLDSSRTTQEVFNEFTLDHPEDFGFNKTEVPVRLASLGGEYLVSRSQAKRLVARFEGFKKVVLDFDQVDEIGQAFADEVFRVFANAHPEVILETIHETTNVKKMINRIKNSNG